MHLEDPLEIIFHLLRVPRRAGLVVAALDGGDGLLGEVAHGVQCVLRVSEGLACLGYQLAEILAPCFGGFGVVVSVHFGDHLAVGIDFLESISLVSYFEVERAWYCGRGTYGIACLWDFGTGVLTTTTSSAAAVLVAFTNADDCLVHGLSLF